MKNFIIVFFTLVFLASCEEVFDPPPKSLLEASLIFSNVEEINSIPITVHGLDQDSLIIFQEKTEMFRLPLSHGDSSSFVIWFDTIPDTLCIKHDTELTYETIESGFYTNHWINSIEFTSNRIDSVVVTDSTVTKIWNENIRLYINDLSASAD